MALKWVYQIDYGHPIDIVEHDNGNLYVVHGIATDKTVLSVNFKHLIPYNKVFLPGSPEEAIVNGLPSEHQLHTDIESLHAIVQDFLFGMASTIVKFKSK